MQAAIRSTDSKKRTSSKLSKSKPLRRLAPLLTCLVLLLFWHWITAMEFYPSFMVPPPAAVFDAFTDALSSGLLLEHAQTTLEEMLYGLLFGIGMGLAVGYAIGKIPLLERLLSPIIVAFQSTPIVAYAPLLVIWFGSGTASKIVTTAVIVFFPTLINAIVGVRSVSPNLRDMMRSLNATWWQMFRHLELPAALPMILAGFKTSATLAVIGAVVGEFVSSSSGLGYLVTLARNQYDTPLVVVTVLTMTAIALTLYSFVVFLEWRLLAWQRRSDL